jgi:hypothetical protein
VHVSLALLVPQTLVAMVTGGPVVNDPAAFAAEPMPAEPMPVRQPAPAPEPAALPDATAEQPAAESPPSAPADEPTP